MFVVRIVKIIFFIVLDIFLAITTAQAKKIPIAMATLEGKAEELTLYRFVMRFVGVFFMIARCDAVENYMFLSDSQLV